MRTVRAEMRFHHRTRSLRLFGLTAFAMACSDTASRRDDSAAVRLVKVEADRKALQDSITRLETRLAQAGQAAQRVDSSGPAIAGYDTSQVRYFRDGGGVVFESATQLEDIYKLNRAGALTAIPPHLCDADGGDKAVILNTHRGDVRATSYLVILRVAVVTGRATGCTGYVVPGQLSRSPQN